MTIWTIWSNDKYVCYGIKSFVSLTSTELHSSLHRKTMGANSYSKSVKSSIANEKYGTQTGDEACVTLWDSISKVHHF